MCLLHFVRNTSTFSTKYQYRISYVSHVFLAPLRNLYNLTNFESSDILSVNNTYTNGATKDVLSVSNTHTIDATLPVFKLEEGGALALLKFQLMKNLVLRTYHSNAFSKTVDKTLCYIAALSCFSLLCGPNKLQQCRPVKTSM